MVLFNFLLWTRAIIVIRQRKRNTEVGLENFLEATGSIYIYLKRLFSPHEHGARVEHLDGRHDGAGFWHNIVKKLSACDRVQTWHSSSKNEIEEKHRQEMHGIECINFFLSFKSKYTHLECGWRLGTFITGSKAEL